MPEGGEHLKVADLMVEGCRVWNKGKIDDTLWPVDQELIRGLSWILSVESPRPMPILILPGGERCGVCRYLPKSGCLYGVLSTRLSRRWLLWVTEVVENRRDFPFADFLRIVKSEIPLEDFASVCWLAWKLWCERNKALHQVPIQSQVVSSDVWLPLQSGYLKLNVDASVSTESDHIGIGAVIRDEKGIILGAMAKSVEGTFSPFLAECIALREGLMMAKELERVTLVVETDVINVVSAVSDNTKFSLESPILEDVKQLLAQ
ncbi:hypothetical protein TIFTF001_010577 [Ficus carica]|uniref:RNase H type-1 domain-containing protein n=1 Tax=Ficus carica TaxID=3494 RepID=A0AA87ZX79_FICCA|nr:hypothetical protein TIFTF001_010577 [Ficus carica]